MCKWTRHYSWWGNCVSAECTHHCHHGLTARKYKRRADWDLRCKSHHCIWYECTSGCTSDSAVNAVTYIFPVLSVSDLPLHSRSAPGPATPAAQHKASTWISQDGYSWTSFHKTQGMSEFLLRSPGVCMRSECCDVCVQVGPLVPYLASWHFCDLSRKDHSSHPPAGYVMTWEMNQLRGVSSCPCVLSACLLLSPNQGTSRAVAAELTISGDVLLYDCPSSQNYS